MNVYENNLNFIIYVFTEFLVKIPLHEAVITFPIIQEYLRNLFGDEAVAALNLEMKKRLNMKAGNRFN